MWGHVLFPCCGKYMLFYISIVGCEKKFWQQPWIHTSKSKHLKGVYPILQALMVGERVCAWICWKKMLGKSSLSTYPKRAVYRVINPKSQKKIKQIPVLYATANGQIFIATSKQHHVAMSGCGWGWPWSYPNIAWQRNPRQKPFDQSCRNLGVPNLVLFCLGVWEIWSERRPNDGQVRKNIQNSLPSLKLTVHTWK